MRALLGAGYSVVEVLRPKRGRRARGSNKNDFASSSNESHPLQGLVYNPMKAHAFAFSIHNPPTTGVLAYTSVGLDAGALAVFSCLDSGDFILTSGGDLDPALRGKLFF